MLVFDYKMMLLFFFLLHDLHTTYKDRNSMISFLSKLKKRNTKKTLKKRKKKEKKRRQQQATLVALFSSWSPRLNPARIWTPPDLFFSRAPLMNRESRVTTDPRRLSIGLHPADGSTWVFFFSTMWELKTSLTQFKVFYLYRRVSPHIK